ncbi:MAG: sigma-70 family RNA polymerase sigma factor [bacterium]|nr:sigma-70 family RNA polymerase sigma factor [bacterium]
MQPKTDITKLLLDWKDGSDQAFETLVGVMYDELRMLARRNLNRNSGSLTLNTSGLVHEAYLKLADHTRLGLENRGHFLAVYSKVMRNILIDMARSRAAVKRGGDLAEVTLDDNHLQIDAQAHELLAIDDALTQLTELDERLAKTVECRFFAGLTEAETAEAMGISDRTVRRNWTKAKTLLQKFLN